MTAPSLDDVRARLESLRDAPVKAPVKAKSGDWHPATILEHCAQSVDGSLSGYPVHRSGLFKATIGRVVLWRFLSKGAMSHDKNGPIPGLETPTSTDFPAAVDRLIAALSAFARSDAAPAPHFVYGPVTKAEYAALHAMHITDHLSDFSG
jgi:hypothetical protein